jgi:predicted  nucleic acid-binding Zn-ribbon protein
MATPSPAQQLANDISSLQSKLGSLQQSVRLTNARDAVEDLQTKVNGAAQRIAALRQKGYVFEKNLESQAASLAQQWNALHPSINQQINSQAMNLQASIRPLETQMSQLAVAARNPMAARPLLSTIQSQVRMLEDKVSAAEKTIDGMYNQFENQVSQASHHLDEVDSMLTNLAEACFQLLPTEAGIAAVKAVWCKSGKEQKDDPEGVLYLTDQRLLFEQKEEVATKKVLFIATEKQKVQVLAWEVPTAVLDKVSTSKQGLMKNEDHIEIRFQPGASLDMAHLHIWQDSEAWQALLNRAKAKEFDNDRAVAVDQTVVEKVKAAPTQCPSCGAILNAVVLRGQDSIKCDYCGAVIRL